VREMWRVAAMWMALVRWGIEELRLRGRKGNRGEMPRDSAPRDFN
jgi:hypothetical protein